MKSATVACIAVFLSLFILTGCGSNEVPDDQPDSLTETGTAMAGAPIVRSARLTLSGALDGVLDAPDNASTVFRGNCPPDMWANFGIQFEHPDYLWVAVSIMTKDPIQPGQVGPVRLDWVDVSLFTKDSKALFFKGSGSFEITLHDPSAASRRMTGLITASQLTGREGAAGKTLDAELAFDVNFSCGVQ